MAGVKGKLVNVAGPELQGGISLQYRLTGVAGQPMVDGFSTVAHPTTDGETVSVLLAGSAVPW